MKRFFAGLCAILVLLSFAACSSDYSDTQDFSGGYNEPSETKVTTATHKETQPETQEQTTEVSDAEPEPQISEEEGSMQKLVIEVGDKTFAATLYDSETVRAFTEMLPLTLSMSELNGNEKYYYLDESLPTDSQRPSGINAGDIMLYGNSCLVLFYDSFSTSYSYTPIGRIDDPNGLAGALGKKDAEVTFKLG